LLTSHLGEDSFKAKVPRLFTAFILSIAFVAIMVKCLLPMQDLNSGAIAAPEGFASLKEFAIRMLGYGPDGFVIPFEIISVLLLMTLICAITIARKTKDEVEKETIHTQAEKKEVQ